MRRCFPQTTSWKKAEIAFFRQTHALNKRGLISFKVNFCNMKNIDTAPDDWPLGNILWFAVLVWFSSSLLSQSAYIAIHGLPYDAMTMLKSLGPFYYLVVALELAMWGGLLTMAWLKFSRARKTGASSTASPAVA